MNGSEWLDSLPEKPGHNRDDKILEAISENLAVCTWTPITSSIGTEHTATFQVCEDAVYVELDDASRFRFQVDAKLAQRCADLLEASLITSKISDLAYQQAQVKLTATILPASADMVTTTKSKQWNASIEKKRNGQTGLIRDCGKTWILSNQLNLKPNVAINYGFYDPRAPYVNNVGIKMWQTLGTRHNSAHTDYSQTLLVMSKTCEVDGEEMLVSDVMAHPVLCKLLSYEGVLKLVRQPGVEI